MILQVSGRTDICALYPKWFINRLKEGYVLVRNPYNKQQVSYINIDRDVVDCIAFCTKNPSKIIPYLKTIDKLGYKYYFMVTITPYDHDIEPGLPPKLNIMKSFINLSNLIGKERVIWRYDPILLNKRYDLEFHLKMFEKMCQLLFKYTNIVIISYLDIYKNIIGKFSELNDEDINYLSKHLGLIATKYNLQIQTCSEKYNLEKYGIVKGSCIDKQYVEKLLGYSLEINNNQNRSNCSCIASIDIGAYSSCNHGCTYCYACNHNIVKKNMLDHNENSPMLLGTLCDSDKVIKRVVSSNKKRQLQLNIF
ncbi:MAG: DUF1848 domain-containing protein [Thomasclavelia sp.]|uniref:DUF1848 domain-containing protein n=1 Tax=Thomasclavelia sp. TaxID=3025757 RepID=UPI0039A38C0F